MPGEKLCPHCGNILRAEGVPDPMPPGRRFARELMFWLALAAVLAYLMGATTTGERVAGLAAIALLIWLLRRSRRRAAPAAASGTGRFRCDYCQGRFEGEDLRDISPRRAEW
jgi:hypothetical protein